MKQIETLSCDDAMSLMRAYGLPCNFYKLTAWLDAGAVPWGVSAQDERGHYRRTIFKKPLVAWLEGLADEQTN